jgi:hypothetical protein
MEQKLVVLTQPPALRLHLVRGTAVEDEMAGPDGEIIPWPDAAETVSNESLWRDVCKLADEMPLPYAQIDVEGSTRYSRQDVL